MTQVSLVVGSLDKASIFQDVIRLDASCRKGIKAGTIFRISTATHSTIAVARGLLQEDGAQSDSNFIRMDEITRDRLGIKNRETHNFKIQKATLWDEVLWAWRATEPTNRINARIALISLVLGIIGLMLGLMALR